MAAQLAQADGGELPVTDRTLYEYVSKGFRNHPLQPAVICMHQPGNHLTGLLGPHTAPASHHHLEWTFRQLETAALGIALGFQAHGVQRGSTIVKFIQNGIEWAVLRYASVLLGLTFVPLDYGMVTLPRQEELRNLLDLLKPAVIVVNDEDGGFAVRSDGV